MDARRPPRGQGPRMTVDVAAEPRAPSKLRRFRRYIPIVIGVLAVGLIFAFVLPSIADYGSVLDTIKELGWGDMVLLVVLTALNIATYAPPLMAALPGLRYFPGLVVTLSSTATSYVTPGGAAVGMGLTYGMLRAWKFAASSVTLAV